MKASRVLMSLISESDRSVIVECGRYATSVKVTALKSGLTLTNLVSSLVAIT